MQAHERLPNLQHRPPAEAPDWTVTSGSSAIEPPERRRWEIGGDSNSPKWRPVLRLATRTARCQIRGTGPTGGRWRCPPSPRRPSRWQGLREITARLFIGTRLRQLRYLLPIHRHCLAARLSCQSTVWQKPEHRKTRQGRWQPNAFTLKSNAAPFRSCHVKL